MQVLKELWGQWRTLVLYNALIFSCTWNKTIRVYSLVISLHAKRLISIELIKLFIHTENNTSCPVAMRSQIRRPKRTENISNSFIQSFFRVWSSGSNSLPVRSLSLSEDQPLFLKLTAKGNASSLRHFSVYKLCRVSSLLRLQASVYVFHSSRYCITEKTQRTCKHSGWVFIAMKEIYCLYICHKSFTTQSKVKV